MAEWLKDGMQEHVMARELGIPEGEHVPMETLERTSKRTDKAGARARLLMTMRRLRRKKAEDRRPKSEGNPKAEGRNPKTEAGKPEDKPADKSADKGQESQGC